MDVKIKLVEEGGVALQSDMDKTVELYMKQKEINKELVDESEKLKEEICCQRSGWEKATVKLGTALLKLDLAKAIIKDFKDYFRENVNPCPYSMLKVIMQADKFLEE